MARITVTDCLHEIDNRFQLVLIAARRTRQLLFGAEPKVEPRPGEKDTVLALREIAAGHIGPEILEEEPMLPNFTRFNEVENPFPEYAEYTGSAESGAPDPFAGEPTDGTAEETLAAALAQAAAKLGIDPPDAAGGDAAWPEAESAGSESGVEPEPEASEAAVEAESEAKLEPEPEPESEPAPEPAPKAKAPEAAGKPKS